MAYVANISVLSCDKQRRCIVKKNWMIFRTKKLEHIFFLSTIVLPCMLSGFKNGIFNTSKRFSENHKNSSSPGAISLIVFITTPFSLGISNILLVWQSVARLTILSQEEASMCLSKLYSRPSDSAISTYKYHRSIHDISFFFSSRK